VASEKGFAQRSVKERIEAFFLDNVGRVVTREEIIEVSRNPTTNKEPENWHQRLSELRTDAGYTILSWRDVKTLKPGQYLMPTKERRPGAHKRVRPSKETWGLILKNADNMCEWNDDGSVCLLKNGEIDPIGGGTVKLTPDHLTPHSINPSIDPNDPSKWRALCSRHQVTKKNFFDSESGKINYIGIMQAAKLEDKKGVYEFLKKYFESA
jgi:hypothetical protein